MHLQNAAMREGIVFECCAVADRCAPGTSEVNGEEGKLGEGDKDSKLEVRGGYSDHWAQWSCGAFFERVCAE